VHGAEGVIPLSIWLVLGMIAADLPASRATATAGP